MISKFASDRETTFRMARDESGHGFVQAAKRRALNVTCSWTPCAQNIRNCTIAHLFKLRRLHGTSLASPGSAAAIPQ